MVLLGIIIIVVVLLIVVAIISACIYNFIKNKSGPSRIANVLVIIIIILIGYFIYRAGTVTDEKKESKPKVEAKKEVEPKTPAQIAKEKEQKEKEAYQQWINNQFSPWDGSHINLVKMVKEKMNNPKSFEHVETTYENKGYKKGITVLMTYRGTNAFGAVVTNQVIADIDYKKNWITWKEVK